MSSSGLAALGGRHLYWSASGPESGPPVLLLHSGLGSVLDWRDQVPALADAGWRAIAFDRWGYGRSDERPGFRPPDFRSDVDDLAGLAGVLQLSHFALVGHSDGGTIALAAAARFPDRVVATVAVAAHVYVELKMRPGIGELARRHADDPAFREGLERRHGPKANALARAWFTGWFRREAWQWDIRERLADIRCPVLIVQGAEDEHATAQHARDIAAHVPDAELWIVPDVGHMVPQAVPALLNERVLAFLEARARPRLDGRSASALPTPDNERG